MSGSAANRSRRRSVRPPRMTPDEEYQLLCADIELQLRGKHVVDARVLVEFLHEAQRVPGLFESAERVADFFEDADNGNWVDGSELFRTARTDHVNRLKRVWRDFDHRRITLRQYLRSQFSAAANSNFIRFKLPEDALESPEDFVDVFQKLVIGLDRVCRIVVDEGFEIAGFKEHSNWILLQSDSEQSLEFASKILEHFFWFRSQTEDVRRLEERSDISEEYAKAAESLAAAQQRHLRVLVEETIREYFKGGVNEALQSAVNTTTTYIGTLDEGVQDGAEVASPKASSAATEQAA